MTSLNSGNNMRNLSHKFKKLGKSVKQTARKYALLGALAVGSVAYASGQDFDRTELPGMDIYSRTNIVSANAYGSGDVNDDGYVDSVDLQAMKSGVKNDYSDINGNGVQSDSEDKEILRQYLNGEISKLPGQWNNLGRSEKISWLNKMLAIDKTDELQYIPGIFECTGFSYLTQFNFGGMENMDNFEFREFYKSKGLTNNRFNITTYNVSVKSNKSPGDATSEGEGHRICGVFVGAENEGEKDDPFDFYQWYFFEPQNDKEVKMGDWNMDINENATIYWMGWQPNISENWKHSNNQMIHFELNGGNPYVPENHFDSDMLKRNPHKSNIKLSSIQDKTFYDENNIYFEEPQITTNVEKYFPSLERILSDTIFTSQKSYSFKVKEVAKLKMGRWNGEEGDQYFLPNLIDSTVYRINVDLGTGIEELKAEHKDINILGNPVSRNTKFRVVSDKFLENGQIYVFDLNGNPLDIIEVNNLSPNEEREIYYSGNAKLTPGLYFIQFVGNNSRVTQKIIIE